MGGVQLVQKTGLAQPQLKSAEFAGEEINNFNGAGRRQEDAVDAVNDAIRSEDVDGEDTTIEVDSQSSEAEFESQALRLWVVTEVITFEQGWHCVRGQDATRRIGVRYHVV